MDDALARTYGQTLRVRACGLCWDEDRLLMVNHHGLTAGDFWAPPGGGIEFGETASQCLEREFLEETGLVVSIGRFLFACELVRQPLHAIELFFEVHTTGGDLIKGDDPELAIIADVRFMTLDELASIGDANKHGIFQQITSAGDLRTLNGFFRI